MFALIEMTEETYIRLSNGKTVEGSIKRVAGTEKMVFNAYRRKSEQHRCTSLICVTPNGRMVESPQRYILRISVNKEIGVAMTKKVMTKETDHATNLLILKSLLK